MGQLVIFLSTGQTYGFHFSKYKGDRELQETLRLPSTQRGNLSHPFQREFHRQNENTSTWYHGVNRSTFSAMSLSNVATPSPHAMAGVTR